MYRCIDVSVCVCVYACVCAYISTADGKVCEHFLKVVVQLLALKSTEFVIRTVFTTAPVPRNRRLFIVVYVGAICALRVLLHEAKGHLFPAVSEIHTRIPTVERRPRPLVAVSVFSC